MTKGFHWRNWLGNQKSRILLLWRWQKVLKFHFVSLTFTFPFMRLISLFLQNLTCALHNRLRHDGIEVTKKFPKCHFHTFKPRHIPLGWTWTPSLCRGQWKPMLPFIPNSPLPHLTCLALKRKSSECSKVSWSNMEGRTLTLSAFSGVSEKFLFLTDM